jgi:alpha-L-arabinofuranosidase
LRKLALSVLRWPGGCFGDNYHWRDGIGPRAERPTRLNIWWKQGEKNEFGTHEFIRFCRLIGTEPYLAMNVGSGTVHIFHRHATDLMMANMAQTINVLQALILTKGDKMCLTPTYWVYDLFKPHRGGTVVQSLVRGPALSFPDRSENYPRIPWL